MSVEQLTIIGLVASGLVYMVNIWSKYTGAPLRRKLLTVILFGVSIALVPLFDPQIIPPLPYGISDPAQAAAAVLEWLGQVVAQGAAIVGAATLIYNILLKQVLDKIQARLVG